MKSQDTLAGLRNLKLIYDDWMAHGIASDKFTYMRLRSLLVELGNQYGANIRTTCGVFAALSPNNDYHGNLKDTHNVLRWATYSTVDRRTFNPRVSTYHPNRDKAMLIAMGAHPDDVLGGQKVISFFHNCYEPENPEWVTVDGHMYWIWMGRRGVVKTRAPDRQGRAPQLNAPLYRTISDAVKFLADCMSKTVPCELQAILWFHWRRIHNIQGSANQELLPADEMIATLKPQKQKHDNPHPKILRLPGAPLPNLPGFSS